jgi:hypothetical protein
MICSFDKDTITSKGSLEGVEKCGLSLKHLGKEVISNLQIDYQFRVKAQGNLGGLAYNFYMRN